MVTIDGRLVVGTKDDETDTFPVYHYIDGDCYGTIAEFISKELAEEWVRWKEAER